MILNAAILVFLHLIDNHNGVYLILTFGFAACVKENVTVLVEVVCIVVAPIGKVAFAIVSLFVIAAIYVAVGGYQVEIISQMGQLRAHAAAQKHHFLLLADDEL